jgi:cyclo(L-tyrosyl-L-tyrosyl) synthase
VRYLLAELPLFLDTPRIAGVQASVFCYHEVPDFLNDVFHRLLALTPASGQGFVRLIHPAAGRGPAAAGQSECPAKYDDA